MHNRHHRERVVLALQRVNYDSFISEMEHAMSGQPPPHLRTNTDPEQRQKNIAWGFAAVLVGSHDYGQNEPETDCADALASILHYARAAFDMDIRALCEQAVEYVEQDYAEEESDAAETMGEDWKGRAQPIEDGGI
jgi:hypothetical protein